jgi:tRNA uridine 5-carboxymethylaminomethyl modification enzyme
MVDDLITQPTTDPYRMFTSRSEYRLLLREDNADRRLTEIGRKIGLVKDDRWERYQEKQHQVERAMEDLRSHQVTSANTTVVAGLGLGELRSGVTLEQLLRRPDVTVEKLKEFFSDLDEYTESALEQVEIAVKYEGYINRQIEQVERFRQQEDIEMPEGIDYNSIPNLSAEVREKLNKVKPRSLGQAGRIQGVTPAAVAIIQVYLRKK